MTVTGTGLLGASVVDFANTPGTKLDVVSASKLTIVSPKGSGTVDVTLRTPGGTRPKVGGDRFRY